MGLLLFLPTNRPALDQLYLGRRSGNEGAETYGEKAGGQECPRPERCGRDEAGRSRVGARTAPTDGRRAVTDRETSAWSCRKHDEPNGRGKCLRTIGHRAGRLPGSARSSYHRAPTPRRTTEGGRKKGIGDRGPGESTARRHGAGPASAYMGFHPTLFLPSDCPDEQDHPLVDAHGHRLAAVVDPSRNRCDPRRAPRRPPMRSSAGASRGAPAPGAPARGPRDYRMRRPAPALARHGPMPAGGPHCKGAVRPDRRHGRSGSGGRRGAVRRRR